MRAFLVYAMSLYPASLENDIARFFDSVCTIDGVDHPCSKSDLSKAHSLEMAGFMAEDGVRVVMRASSFPNGAPALNKVIAVDGVNVRIKTSSKDGFGVYLTCVNLTK